MTLQNRVTPFGEIVAEPWRGSFTGNRGCLHDDAGELGARRWRHHAWVCCLLAFRGRRRPVMPPGRWTALFFWDEAAALAAGHRPCGACRRADYRRFMACWRAAGLPGAGPGEVDRVLHRARIGADRRQRRHRAPSAGLPDGTFVAVDPTVARPALVFRSRLHALDPLGGGYGPALPPPPEVIVLSPRPVVAVLSAGYRPEIRDESRLLATSQPPLDADDGAARAHRKPDGQRWAHPFRRSTVGE